jgi:hypothetical protein
MARSARLRKTYLHHDVTVEYPRLMSHEQLAEILEVFVRAVRNQPGLISSRYRRRRSGGGHDHTSIPRLPRARVHSDKRDQGTT